jgi:YihY family inner membrane protein
LAALLGGHTGGVDIGAILGRVDAWQRRRPATAFPAAVVKKFGDDQGGNLAALITYYAFFSIFPLLLVFVTVLGFVLHNDPSARDSIVKSTAGQFPVLGAKQLKSLKGSGVALAIGVAGALWAGLGVTLAVENAMNSVWNVPRKERPDFLKARLRGLALLAILGTGNIVATVVAGVVTGTVLSGLAATLGGIVVALALDFALFLAAFRLLTARDVALGDLLPGVTMAAILFYALQSLGGVYVNHVVKGQNQAYGTFAVVLGLLSWLYLAAQVVVLSAEVNVVRARRLWPRHLFGPPDETDRRALEHLAKEEERVREQRVDVEFDDAAGPEGAGAARD